jgi:UDPglucose 6-dehydrogenase
VYEHPKQRGGLMLRSRSGSDGPVGVLGLWHQGGVTAACLAEAGNHVLAIDPDARVIDGLTHARPPVSEPGLSDLISRCAERLHFSVEPAELADVRCAWVAFDTPVDEHDHGDVEWVLRTSASLLQWLSAGTLVVVSSQLPVGGIARLQARCATLRGEDDLRFACVPENLRLGSALDCFRAPERIVAGTRSERDRRELAELLAPFCTDVQWMRVESAEMTKHALNGFLATSIAFMNEVAVLCESIGADAAEVARGLKSERRIGPRAYLEPGDAFAGGTLARDIGFLRELAARYDLPAHVCSGVAAGNADHKHWTRRKLSEILDEGRSEGEGFAGMTVAIWGLTYKPGTDTMRRSSAVALCQWLHGAGVAVQAHDPAVEALTPELDGKVKLCASALQAAAGADVLVLCTPWREYREVPIDDVLEALAQPVVIDPAGWLSEHVTSHPRAHYIRVGATAQRSAMLNGVSR